MRGRITRESNATSARASVRRSSRGTFRYRAMIGSPTAGPSSRRIRPRRSRGSRYSNIAPPAAVGSPSATPCAIRESTSLPRALILAAAATTAVCVTRSGYLAAKYCAILPP
jgi:hypothetical protein